MTRALKHPSLLAPGLAHGFFTRLGGVSGGLYGGLNCGTGSADDPAHVAENRARAMAALGLPPENLRGLYQHHSAECLIVEDIDPAARPMADAMATARPGLALSVLTADCAPVLLADHKAGVVGAAHAGWKGATGGVLENTISAMESLGAARANISAVIGPSISIEAYEVGEDFIAAATAADSAAEQFVKTRAGWPKPHFDLPGYVTHALTRAQIGQVAQVNPACTYAHADLFYSYRRTTHLAEPDYGRLISIIALG